MPIDDKPKMCKLVKTLLVMEMWKKGSLKLCKDQWLEWSIQQVYIYLVIKSSHRID